METPVGIVHKGEFVIPRKIFSKENFLLFLEGKSRLNGYYTGKGYKYEEAGLLYGNEFVVPKEGVDQETGQPRIEYMINIKKHFPKDWKDFLNAEGMPKEKKLEQLEKWRKEKV